MIIAELPYVSEFLMDTICNMGFPAVQTENTSTIFKGRSPKLFKADQVVAKFKEEPNSKIFTNSENSINWVFNNLQFTDLPRQIDLFKDKVKFRQFMAEWHPNYFFQEIDFMDLEKIDISNFPSSFIIKPSIGFFSMGVYRVSHHDEWPGIVARIQNEIEAVKSIYPVEVFDHKSFIAEEIIIGTEYAFDAYFTSEGEPVITGVYKHPFSSGTDVSDRVYLTSESIVMDNIEPFTNWLKKVGKKAKLHDFPLHVEVRVGEHGVINPIEVNPLRFGGFCTTADCTWFAYGVNSYEFFFNEKKPNWSNIFSTRKNVMYSLLVLNNSTGIDGKNILGFDYEKIASCLENPLEIRPINYKEFPLFGFIFTKTRSDNYKELDYLLNSDLNEFLIK